MYIYGFVLASGDLFISAHCSGNQIRSTDMEIPTEIYFKLLGNTIRRIYYNLMEVRAARVNNWKVAPVIKPIYIISCTNKDSSNDSVLLIQLRDSSKTFSSLTAVTHTDLV